MDTALQFGQLITDGERRRDAVHVAVAPVTAAYNLSPGQHVGLIEIGNTELVGPLADADNIGIVDPFLRTPLMKGERFWLFLYPSTITGLRHAWSHPTFTAAATRMRNIDLIRPTLEPTDG